MNIYFPRCVIVVLLNPLFQNEYIISKCKNCTGFQNVFEIKEKGSFRNIVYPYVNL